MSTLLSSPFKKPYMRRAKQVVSLFMILCLLLTGCASRTPQEPAPPPEESLVTPTPAATPEPTPELPELDLQLEPNAFLLGSDIRPDDLLPPLSPSLSLRFADEIDTSRRGAVPVTVIASLDGIDLAEASTEILLCDDILDLELQEEGFSVQSLRLKVRAVNVSGYHADFKRFEPDKPSIYPLSLKNRAGDELMIGLRVRDTTPPAGKAVPTQCYVGYPLSASDLVSGVKDAQRVEASFLTEPDWSLPGERTVTVSLTDASGNETLIPVPVTFVKDTQPPELHVSLKPYYYVGDSVAYMKNASAIDNVDPDCRVELDKSQVKYWQVGTYPVVYTATDRDGNTSCETVEITFSEPSVTEEEIDALTEQIFAEILTDGMSTAQQAKAIYNYVSMNIRYTPTADKSDWKGEAYRGLTTHKGNCFTYFAAAKLLLSKIDCKTMDVERLGGKTHHYWLLVNVGTGWYHFDPTPNKRSGFMRTDAELLTDYGKLYWNYDKSDFPEVATEKFKMF